MALVLFVILSSILKGSIQNDSSSISAKIGSIPSHIRLLAVTRKEKGVVIAFPFTSSNL